jgi:hypothetical protein
MDTTNPCVTHAEYLEEVYTYERDAGGLYIPFYDIMEKLFDDTIGPDEAATRVSSFVLSNDYFLSVYSGVIASIIGAAYHISEARDLEKLANLVLALSRLPDIRNKSSETLHIHFNLKDHEIAPGQVIKVDDGKIWSDLPAFATGLSDCMRGTTSYSQSYTII